MHAATRSRSTSTSSSSTDTDVDDQVLSSSRQEPLSRRHLATYSFMAPQADRQVKRPLRALTSRMLQRQAGDPGPGAEQAARLDDRLSPRLDDRWPLALQDLQATVDSHPLAETIRDLATATIRRDSLRPAKWTAPHGSPGPDSLDDGHDVDDLQVPLDLVRSTTAFVDRILTGLAVLRPPEPNTIRQKMRPMGWQAVLSAAALTTDADCLDSAHQRVKAIYEPNAVADPDKDVLSHRVKVLRQFQSAIKRPAIDEVYEPAIPPLPKAKRPHHSKEEQERRQAKREARLEKNEAKSRLCAAKEAARLNKQRSKRRQQTD